MNKDEELQQALQANQDLRAGLRQTIESQQEHIIMLERLVASLQKRLKILEGQQAKNSHNSSLPPSSDRFVRPPQKFAAKERKETRWPVCPPETPSSASGFCSCRPQRGSIYTKP